MVVELSMSAVAFASFDGIRREFDPAAWVIPGSWRRMAMVYDMTEVPNPYELGEMGMSADQAPTEGVVGAYDRDGDGRVDMIAYDTDGDGVADKVVLDTDGDGVADTLMLDRDKDGRVDFVGVDHNADGDLDVAATDTDRDGSLDTVRYSAES
jgi:hypothetical protein